MILSIGWQCLREEHSTNTKYHSSYTSPAQVFDPNWTPRIIEVPNGPQSSLIAVLKMPSNPSFPILRIIQLGFVWKSVILPNYQNSSFFWKKKQQTQSPPKSSKPSSCLASFLRSPRRFSESPCFLKLFTAHFSPSAPKLLGGWASTCFTSKCAAIVEQCARLSNPYFFQFEAFALEIGLVSSLKLLCWFVLWFY